MADEPRDLSPEPPRIHATWGSDGRFADLRRNDERLADVRLVDDWYEPGARNARLAWVVHWFDDNAAHRSLVELDAKAAMTRARREELTWMAIDAIDRGRHPCPAPFGAAATGLASATELSNRIQLMSHALQRAESRLSDAARTTDQSSGVLVAIAVTETLAWLRVLDEVLDHTWRRLPREIREAELLVADDRIARGDGAGSDRNRPGQPYREWFMPLVGLGFVLTRNELLGFRWLAGQLLHRGPLPATELRQRHAGEAPRWEWRQADAIDPRRRNRQDEWRAQYDRRIAGRDIVGTLNLTAMLIEMEHLFSRALRHATPG